MSAERTFAVARDGETWQVVTSFLRIRPGPLTMRAAGEAGTAAGLRRTEANDLARRLNEWTDSTNERRPRRTRWIA